MKRHTTTLLVLCCAGVIADTTSARADDKPALQSETIKAQTATTGKTDVAKGGFATGAVTSEEDARQATDLSVQAGGLFSSGNAKTVAVTAGSKFRLRREEHQLTLQFAANFARAGKKGTPVDTTVENYQGLARYDLFLTDHAALFLQSSARHDRFQGLDLRLNVDPGFAYYFVNTKKQQLRAEVGYDLQHDIRRDASRVQTPDPPPPPGSPPLPLLDKTNTLHNARFFVGYDNKLYKEVAFTSGLEFLQNLSDAGTYRFVFDVGIKSNIAESLAIATTYTMRYENKPLPSVEKADSIASINLVYTLF